MTTDDDPRSDESRETFAYFSGEYAQALQAFKAIENQSTTLLLLGVGEDLRGFVDQFIEMLRRNRGYEEGLPRRALIDAFRVIEDADLVGAYRRKMSSLLF